MYLELTTKVILEVGCQWEGIYSYARNQTISPLHTKNSSTGAEVVATGAGDALTTISIWT